MRNSFAQGHITVRPVAMTDSTAVSGKALVLCVYTPLPPSKAYKCVCTMTNLKSTEPCRLGTQPPRPCSSFTYSVKPFLMPQPPWVSPHREQSAYI